MLIEDILLILFGGGISFLFIARPVYKFVKAIIPQRKDALQEAKERLETARRDLEAAKLNEEAEKLYAKMYKETMEEESSSELEEENKNDRSIR